MGLRYYVAYVYLYTYTYQDGFLQSRVFGFFKKNQWSDFFFKNGPNPASFCSYSSFSHDKYSTHTINYCVLGT